MHGGTDRGWAAKHKRNELLLPRLLEHNSTVTEAVASPIIRTALRTPKDNNVQKNSPPKNPRKIWYWLLVLPYLAILWLPSYNRIEPIAFGVPFFYWYQLLWVVLSTLIIAVVLHLSHGRKRQASPMRKR